MTAPDPVPPSSGARRFLALVPLLAFLALAALFYTRLGAGDATRIPSALIGKQVPTFTLPALAGSNTPALSDADLKTGEPVVLNVFSSWCVPCRVEHPELMKLKAKGVKIVGLGYKDTPANLAQLLRNGGNPFAAIGVDEPGRVAIDFGVYGVPETFIVRGDGTIAKKIVGGVTVANVEQALAEAQRPR